jgi:hypothetical protein
LRRFHELDHVVEKTLAGVCRDAYNDFVAQHARAPRDRASVATRLADHRRGLARDGGLVDGRRAFDDITVRRDHLARRHDKQVAFAQFGRADGQERTIRGLAPCHGLRARLAQRVGLRLSASFGEGLGKIREQHREPQPHGDLNTESQVLALWTKHEADGRK